MRESWGEGGGGTTWDRKGEERLGTGRGRNDLGHEGGGTTWDRKGEERLGTGRGRNDLGQGGGGTTWDREGEEQLGKLVLLYWRNFEGKNPMGFAQSSKVFSVKT